MRPALPIALLTLLVPLVASCGGGGGGDSGGGTAISSSSSSSNASQAGIPSYDPPGSVEIAYGPAPQEFGDLRLPSAATFGAGPYPVAVIVHGGCWTSGVGTKVSTAELADALTKRGIATWNIEYRAIGDPGGGFPGTFTDWSAATNYVRVLAQTQPLDLNRVIVVGHSAGGHGALWIAARKHLPPTGALYPDATDPLPLMAVVDLDGPGELKPIEGYDPAMCGTAAVTLMGGTPDQVPNIYAQASPSELLPFGIPQYMVHATFVPTMAAQHYHDIAVAAGDSVTLIDQSTSGHFQMITPGTPQEAQVETTITGIFSSSATAP